MAGEHHWRQRGIASRDFAHHIAAGGRAEIARGERQLHRDRAVPSAREHPFEIRGIGQAECARMDWRNALKKSGAAGMRIAVPIGTDRADHRRPPTLTPGASPPHPTPEHTRAEKTDVKT